MGKTNVYYILIFSRSFVLSAVSILGRPLWGRAERQPENETKEGRELVCKHSISGETRTRC